MQLGYRWFDFLPSLEKLTLEATTLQMARLKTLSGKVHYEQDWLTDGLTEISAWKSSQWRGLSYKWLDFKPCLEGDMLLQMVRRKTLPGKVHSFTVEGPILQMV